MASGAQGGVSPQPQAKLRAISCRASWIVLSSYTTSHFTMRSMMPNSRFLSLSCASPVEKCWGQVDRLTLPVVPTGTVKLLSRTYPDWAKTHCISGGK